MYQQVLLRDEVRVPPGLAHMEVKDAIKEVIKRKYEGAIDKDIGFIVKVLDAKPINTGIVILGDPNIYFKAEFKALTFTVHPNEVYLAYVKDIMEFGAFVVIGPFEALLHISQISKERFVYDKKSKELKSKDGSKKIKVGDVLLVKVSTVSMKGNAKDVKISVTMRQDGFGPIKEKKKAKAKAKSSKKAKKAK